MKSMPLFKVTGANGISAKQAGAPGTSSSLPRLIRGEFCYEIFKNAVGDWQPSYIMYYTG